MDHTRFGVEFVTAFPMFRAEPGDRLVVRVGHEEAITLCRVLPCNYGALVEVLERGIVRPLNSRRSPADLVSFLTDPLSVRHWRALHPLPQQHRGHELRHLRIERP